MQHQPRLLSILNNRGYAITRILFCLLCILFALAPRAQTVNAKPVYISINYIKTNPGKQGAYLDLLKTYSKKINEFNFKQGRIMGTYLNSVVLPFGSSADYDFAAVTVSADLNFMLNDTVPVKSTFKKLFPEYSDTYIESILNQYREVRTMVKREIFTGLAEIAPDAPPAKFATIDFMKAATGKEGEYVKLEKEFWMPIHKERIKMGLMTDWLLMGKFMPYSSTDSYNYVTGNFFNDVSFLQDGKYAEAIKKVFPNADVAKSFAATDSSRIIVKEELWKLEYYIDATNTKK